MLAEQHDEWIESRRYLGLYVAKSRLRLVQHDDTTADDKEVTLPAITAQSPEPRSRGDWFTHHSRGRDPSRLRLLLPTCRAQIRSV